MGLGHTVRENVRNDNIRDRLKVEDITERWQKVRLSWFGVVKGRYKEYAEDKYRRRYRLGEEEGKTEAEMDALCQPRHESYRDIRK